MTHKCSLRGHSNISFNRKNENTAQRAAVVKTNITRGHIFGRRINFRSKKIKWTYGGVPVNKFLFAGMNSITDGFILIMTIVYNN